MKPLTSNQRERILEMLKEGAHRDLIASAVGVTPGQVSAIAAHKKMGTYKRAGPLADQEHDTGGPHSAGSKVLQMNPRTTLRELESPQGSILVGVDVNNGPAVYWNPSSNGGSANPHVLILGESGFGKTYTTSCLLAELAQSAIPSIIFDYGQGFTSATLPPAFRKYANPIDFELNRDGIAINPLEIFPVDLHGPATVAQRIADTFARVDTVVPSASNSARKG